jgi:beta-phosphoglucomutase-like phosphatase (HAD superfamily)
MSVKITKIYLDMDGVICDFHKRYTELFGTLPERDDKSKTFHKNFDTFIEVRSFATLDMMPGAITLIRALEELYEEYGVPTEILSSTASPKRHEAIMEQKQEWLQKHNVTFKQNFVPGKQLKPEFAESHAIIIDDTVSVIDGWRRAGGLAIWHNNVPATLAMLKVWL